MKIAVVVERFPSLSETFVLNQVIWLLEAGHDVRIFAVRRSPEAVVHEEFERYQLAARTRYARAFSGGHHRRQLQMGSFVLGQVALGRVSAGAVLRGVERSGMRALPVWTYPSGDAEFDAIVAHFGPNGVHAAEMRRAGLLQGPLATFFHGYDMNPARPAIRRGYDRLFEDGDLFLPVSRYFRDRLLAWGAPPDRTVVHHMGVDPDRFAWRRGTVVDAPFRLLSVARLVPKKGLEFGIRAAARVGIAYTIAGEGPERAKLQRLIGELGAERLIRLVGGVTQSQVAELMSECHALLAPSVTTEDGEEEGIPVALMEAMASGLPVISTRHSGIPELVEDGVSGCLVEERQVDQLAACLQDLLDHPERLPEMGRAGRTMVERHFNTGTLHARLVELLHAAS